MLTAINFLSIFSIVSLVVHGLGIVNAAHAVMNVQSSRGAIAWGIALITLPWFAIPLYWILGKNKFHGYAEALQKAYLEHQKLVHHAYTEILRDKATLPKEWASLAKLVAAFTPLPFTANNIIELLIDGKQTYAQMLQAIANAENYVLLQSYIINSDEIGNQFKEALIIKAREGIRIHILYDEIGSQKLSRTYLQSLRQHGIRVSSFRSTKGKGNRFQLNFRNHRKILIIDGKIAFMGGLNIGDEYLGKNPDLGYWRDTHLKLQGTAVKCLQRTFLGDWYWATQQVPQVSWKLEKNDQQNHIALILATGPADKLPACTLFFLSLINQTQKRLWIASPYFVPDDSILNALKLAAMRGVDVRIILPNRPDHLFVYFCSFSYYTELQDVGIKLYRYNSGFMHQKVILCDHLIAGVGTVNLDNRSFCLNFEVMTFVLASDLIGRIEKMLIDDLNASNLVDLSLYQHKTLWFKLGARISRLLSPIL
jgi:cardiolipin synthase